jgi:hypothetical protein
MDRQHLIAVSAILIAAMAGFIIIDLPYPLSVLGIGTTETYIMNYDLDQDLQPERYVLQDLRLTVADKGRELWRSPADWRVTSLHIADVTHDSRPDLLLVVWKRGSFGQARPFWHTGPDHELTCHLYVYNLVNKRLKPVWMSSALDQPIKNLEIKDTDGDGRNELFVTGYHSYWQRLWVHSKSPVNKVTTWQWQDWGFCRVK